MEHVRGHMEKVGTWRCGEKNEASLSNGERGLQFKFE